MLKIWLTSPAFTTVLIIWRAARSRLIIVVIAISLFIIHVIFIHNSKHFAIIFCIGNMILWLVAARYIIFLWKKIITITLLVSEKMWIFLFKNIIKYPLNLQSYWKTFKTSVNTKHGLYTDDATKHLASWHAVIRTYLASNLCRWKTVIIIQLGIYLPSAQWKQIPQFIDALWQHETTCNTWVAICAKQSLIPGASVTHFMF